MSDVSFIYTQPYTYFFLKQALNRMNAQMCELILPKRLLDISHCKHEQDIAHS